METIAESSKNTSEPNEKHFILIQNFVNQEDQNNVQCQNIKDVFGLC